MLVDLLGAAITIRCSVLRRWKFTKKFVVREAESETPAFVIRDDIDDGEGAKK